METYTLKIMITFKTMYKLTDYSLSELRIIAEAVQKQIEFLEFGINNAKKYVPEGEFFNDLTKKDMKAVSVLKEHNVHVLTAIQIVKEREQILNN